MSTDFFVLRVVCIVDCINKNKVQQYYHSAVLITCEIHELVFQERPAPTAEEKFQEKELKERFKRIAGEDMEIDPYELKDILNVVFTKGMLQFLKLGTSF